MSHPQPHSAHRPVRHYSPLRLAFADLCARDPDLGALSFERAMADARWCRVIREHARRFRG